MDVRTIETTTKVAVEDKFIISQKEVMNELEERPADGEPSYKELQMKIKKMESEMNKLKEVNKCLVEERNELRRLLTANDSILISQDYHKVGNSLLEGSPKGVMMEEKSPNNLDQHSANELLVATNHYSSEVQIVSNNSKMEAKQMDCNNNPGLITLEQQESREENWKLIGTLSEDKQLDTDSSKSTKIIIKHLKSVDIPKFNKIKQFSFKQFEEKVEESTKSRSEKIESEMNTQQSFSEVEKALGELEKTIECIFSSQDSDKVGNSLLEGSPKGVMMAENDEYIEDVNKRSVNADVPLFSREDHYLVMKTNLDLKKYPSIITPNCSSEGSIDQNSANELPGPSVGATSECPSTLLVISNNSDVVMDCNDNPGLITLIDMEKQQDDQHGQERLDLDGIINQDVVTRGPDKVIISIDGGGCRGNMEVEMLTDIMKLLSLICCHPDAISAEKIDFSKKESLEQFRKLLDDTKCEIELSQVADVIAGTSAGAIIAFALVGGKTITKDGKEFRVPMPLQEIGPLCTEFAKNVFKPKFPLKRLKRKVLKKRSKVLKRLLKETFGESRTNDFEEEGKCKAVAVALHYPDKSSELFYTTESTSEENNWQMVEVLMATSAAPTYLKTPVVVTDRNGKSKKYIDGGIMANSPLHEVIEDIEETHGGRNPSLSVLSLAPPSSDKKLPGYGDSIFTKKDWGMWITDLVTDGERIFEKERKRKRRQRDVFKRVEPRTEKMKKKFKLDDHRVGKMKKCLMKESVTEPTYFIDILESALLLCPRAIDQRFDENQAEQKRKVIDKINEIIKQMIVIKLERNYHCDGQCDDCEKKIKIAREGVVYLTKIQYQVLMQSPNLGEHFYKEELATCLKHMSDVYRQLGNTEEAEYYGCQRERWLNTREQNRRAES